MRGQVQGTGRTWVWHENDSRVIGYFTLAAHVLVRDELGLSRNKSRGLPQKLPAILIAKLALDRTLHGSGAGGELLADALERCVQVSHIVGARYVVVDAIDDRAADFYLHYGFDPVPGTPSRLIQRVSDVEASLTPDF